MHDCFYPHFYKLFCVLFIFKKFFIGNIKWISVVPYGDIALVVVIKGFALIITLCIGGVASHNSDTSWLGVKNNKKIYAITTVIHRGRNLERKEKRGRIRALKRGLSDQLTENA